MRGLALLARLIVNKKELKNLGFGWGGGGEIPNLVVEKILGGRGGSFEVDTVADLEIQKRDFRYACSLWSTKLQHEHTHNFLRPSFPLT